MLLPVALIFFSSLPPPPSTPHSLRQFPHLCSCPWVMHIRSLASPFPALYFTSPWIFCNYLFVLLNPLTSSPTPYNPLLSGNHQNTPCIHDSVSVLLVCLVCFYFYFFKDFIYLFLERGEGREKEKHQCVVASSMLPTVYLACNPGMCPDWEWNR